MVVIVTDAKYRMTLPIIRSLGEAGYEVVCVSAKGDGVPVGAYSKWCKESIVLNGDKEVGDELSDVCARYNTDGERPVLLCVGGSTCDKVAEKLELFKEVCKVVLSNPETLELANNKEKILSEAAKIGVPVPRTYDLNNAVYPCVIKYRCGEKLGITASERYAIAYRADELNKTYKKYIGFDESPLIQEYLVGEGVGVSVLMDEQGTAVDYICHRRLRECPASGGPSSLCESFFNVTLVGNAVSLLRHIGYVGIGMVEFKADKNGTYKLMEINPRVWGSYALTRAAKSHFSENWARLSAGEKLPGANLDKPPYKVGAKMQFLPSELKLILSNKKNVFKIAGDILNPCVHDGVFELTDVKGGYGYLKSIIGRSGHDH